MDDAVDLDSGAGTSTELEEGSGADDDTPPAFDNVGEEGAAVGPPGARAPARLGCPLEPGSRSVHTRLVNTWGTPTALHYDKLGLSAGGETASPFPPVLVNVPPPGVKWEKKPDFTVTTDNPPLDDDSMHVLFVAAQLTQAAIDELDEKQAMKMFAQYITYRFETQRMRSADALLARVRARDSSSLVRRGGASQVQAKKVAAAAEPEEEQEAAGAPAKAPKIRPPRAVSQFLSPSAAMLAAAEIEVALQPKLPSRYMGPRIPGWDGKVWHGLSGLRLRGVDSARSGQFGARSDALRGQVYALYDEFGLNTELAHYSLLAQAGSEHYSLSKESLRAAMWDAIVQGPAGPVVAGRPRFDKAFADHVAALAAQKAAVKSVRDTVRTYQLPLPPGYALWEMVAKPGGGPRTGNEQLNLRTCAWAGGGVGRGILSLPLCSLFSHPTPTTTTHRQLVRHGPVQPAAAAPAHPRVPV